MKQLIGFLTKWGKAYSGKNFENLPEPEKLRAALSYIESIPT